MLAGVLLVVRTAVLEPLRIDRGVGDGVELVVAEHDLRGAGVHHRPDEPERVQLAPARGR